MCCSGQVAEIKKQDSHDQALISQVLALSSFTATACHPTVAMCAVGSPVACAAQLPRVLCTSDTTFCTSDTTFFYTGFARPDWCYPRGAKPCHRCMVLLTAALHSPFPCPTSVCQGLLQFPRPVLHVPHQYSHADGPVSRSPRSRLPICRQMSTTAEPTLCEVSDGLCAVTVPDRVGIIEEKLRPADVIRQASLTDEV